MPTTLPHMVPNIKRDAEAAVLELKNGESARILRLEASLSSSPVIACRMRHRSRHYTLMVHGLSKRVFPPEWAPLNLRRALGLCIGMPLAVLSASAVIVYALRTARTLPGGFTAFSELLKGGTLDNTTAFLTAASLVFLGSTGYLLWALFTKPKPKKGDQSDTV